MESNTGEKWHDLSDRTKSFAIAVRSLLKKLNQTISNRENSKQLDRLSASVAANYIEACESLSKEVFYYRIKLCRKEAKESILFLCLLDANNNNSHKEERDKLVREATELMKIFRSIVSKANN
jgi:four helix bundle protein